MNKKNIRVYIFKIIPYSKYDTEKSQDFCLWLCHARLGIPTVEIGQQLYTNLHNILEK